MSEPQGQPPLPAAQPARASGPVTASPAGPVTSPGVLVPEALPAGDDPAGLSAEEETELIRLQNKAASARLSGTATVQLKVESPHSEMQHAGYSIGTEWTDVPALMAPRMFEAAQESGVILTQNTES